MLWYKAGAFLQPVSPGLTKMIKIRDEQARLLAKRNMYRFESLPIAIRRVSRPLGPLYSDMSNAPHRALARPLQINRLVFRLRLPGSSNQFSREVLHSIAQSRYLRVKYRTRLSRGAKKMNKLFALLLLSQGMVFSSLVTLRSPAAATSAPTLVSAYLGTKGGANTMVAGGTLQIIAYGIYSDGSTGALPDAQGNVVTAWNTTNHAVAKISSLGHATALAAGTVSIEATVGTLIASPWSVTVTKAPVSTNAPTLVSVHLGTNGNANTMVTGSTLQIIAHGIYSDGSTGTLPDAQGNVVTAWNTTNHAVAKISSLGHATALGAGPVNMEGMVGTLIASPWSVTVSNAPATVVPSPPTTSCSANPSIINQGGTAVITATGSSPQNLPVDL